MMKLENIDLAHFRGFEKLELSFHPRITVIAGVNGVGKSGILQAIAHAMSWALPKFTPSFEKPLAFSDEDVKNGSEQLFVQAYLTLPDAQIRVNIVHSLPLPAAQALELKNNRTKLQEDARQKGLSTIQKQTLRKEIAAIDSKLAIKAENALVQIAPDEIDLPTKQYVSAAQLRPNQPIAVMYGTSRRLSRLPPVLPKTKNMEIGAAYANALTMAEVSLSDFAYWLRALGSGEIGNPALSSKLLGQLEQAITVFLPGMHGLSLHQKTPPRLSVQKEGKHFFLSQLSDGERGLLALVFDLVRRLAIANPNSENPVRDGVALVLIDEIELHLHPKWQRGVLAHLKSLFKSCQFIVTTHSPSILGEVPARCVRYLEMSEGKVNCFETDAALGLDVNGILQNLMEAPVRTLQYERHLHYLFLAVEQEDFSKANRRITRLQKILGEHDPDLIRARALMHFLQDDE